MEQKRSHHLIAAPGKSGSEGLWISCEKLLASDSGCEVLVLIERQPPHPGVSWFGIATAGSRD
jgi:hypothetical protein